MEVWNSLNRTTKVYSTPDLIDESIALETTTNSLEALADKIEKSVMPGIWDSTGGVSTIRPFPEKDGLVVTTNMYVHEQLNTYLKEIRAKQLAMRNSKD